MSRYTVYVVPAEFQAIKKLPGNVRQQVKRAIDALADDPRPSIGKRLKLLEEHDPGCEAWRLRIGNWRIVYLIAEKEKNVDVVAIRKRPPYDYGDLAGFLESRV